MFKFLIFVIVTIEVCQGARIPRDNPHEIETVKLESENGDNGEYKFMYEGSDGSFREEKAVPVNVGQEDEHLAITGSYRYISAEGKEIEVHYTADTRGFIITGQTVHESSSGQRQAKSIQSSDESKNDNPSKNSRQSLSENPSKSLPETPIESTNKTPVEVISEPTSVSSSESPSQVSSEAPSDKS